jgi:transcriptional regulator with XRE-family HTH domain
MTAVAVREARAVSARVWGSVLEPLESVKRMGAALKVIREMRGMTQYAVAERMGLTVDAYRNYEGGRRRLTADQLPALARALGVSTGTLNRRLFGEDDEGEPPSLVERIAAVVGPQRAHMVAEINEQMDGLSPEGQEEFLRAIRIQLAGIRALDAADRPDRH